MASDRLLRFAQAVTAGSTPSDAARAAGYAETTARTAQKRLMRMAREAGLLPSEDEQRSVVEILREIATPERLGRIFEAQIEAAEEGDLAAARFTVEYLAGKPTQSVELQAVVDKYITRWPDDPEAEDDGDADGE